MGILYPMYDGHVPTAEHPGFCNARKGQRGHKLPNIRRMRRQRILYNRNIRNEKLIRLL